MLFFSKILRTFQIDDPMQWYAFHGKIIVGSK